MENLISMCLNLPGESDVLIYGNIIGAGALTGLMLILGLLKKLTFT